MRQSVADRMRSRRARVASLWAAVLGVCTVVTSIDPAIGMAGAVLSLLLSVALVAAVSIEVGRAGLRAAIQRHGCHDARLPTSALPTVGLIFAVVVVGTAAVLPLVLLTLFAVVWLGDHVAPGDTGRVFVVFTLAPIVGGVMLGAFVLALRSRRLTALFVKMSRPAPWARRPAVDSGSDR